MSAAEIIKLLGGRKALGIKRGKSSFDDLLYLSRNGIPVSVFRHCEEELQIPLVDLQKVLCIPERTFQRRLKEERLKMDESDKLIRFSEIFFYCVRVLGSREDARYWLMTENIALGNRKPISVLDTQVGTDEVKNILGRIEHGVFS